jgi:hypothetical protein
MELRSSHTPSNQVLKSLSVFILASRGKSDGPLMAEATQIAETNSC